MSEETALEKINRPLPAPIPPEQKKINVREYLLSAGKLTFILSVLMVTIYWARSQQAISSRLAKVPTEAWITLLTPVIGIVWKFYADNEKAKIAIAQSTAITNAQAIKALDNRIDSILNQIQDLKNIQLDDTSNIGQLEKNLTNLRVQIVEEKSNIRLLIADQRSVFLAERIEIVKEFYKELNAIHLHISTGKTINGYEKLLSEICYQMEENNKKIAENNRVILEETELLNTDATKT